VARRTLLAKAGVTAFAVGLAAESRTSAQGAATSPLCARRRGGEPLSLLFCDVFVMRDAKIRQLISYLVPVGS
jgi:hypothetical protein